MKASRFIIGADGMTLHRRVLQGQKLAPVVYVSHAQPTHSGNFQRLGAALNGRGWTVVAGDLRGHGGSTNASYPVGHLPPQTGWNMLVADLKDHLEATFAGVDWDQRMVIGANISALVLLDVLKQWPDLARHVVLMSAPRNQPHLAAMARAFVKARMMVQAADIPDEQTLHHLYTFLGAHLKNRRHLAELMTAERSVIDELIADEKAWPTPTLGYWAAIFEGYQKAWKWPSGFKVAPGTRVLGLWGEEDTFLRQASHLEDMRAWFSTAGFADFRPGRIAGRQAFYLGEKGARETADTIADWLSPSDADDHSEAQSFTSGSRLERFYHDFSERVSRSLDRNALEPDELVELCYTAISDETRWVEMLHRLELAHGSAVIGQEALDLLVQKLMPDWDRAFRLNKQVMAAATLGVLLQALVDRLDIGVAILSDDRELIHANPAFSTALSRLDSGFARESVQAGLMRLLGEAELHDCRHKGDQVVTLDGRPIGFMFRPRALVQTALQRSGPSTMLVLRVADTDPAAQGLKGEFLELAYGLTRQEATIAFMIASGQSPDSIADSLGVSINTIRTHLKRCYDKMDVDGQTEMVAHLLSGPIGWIVPQQPQFAMPSENAAAAGKASGHDTMRAVIPSSRAVFR